MPAGQYDVAVVAAVAPDTTPATIRSLEPQAPGVRMFYGSTTVITDGVGLNITVMSYLDHLDFGIVADRDSVDDAWSMLEGLGHALDELMEGAPAPVA